jgi:hypothetical protein
MIHEAAAMFVLIQMQIEYIFDNLYSEFIIL